MGLSKSVAEKLKLLHVLHLEGVTGSMFLNNLVHLRYLSVWFWHGEVVEETICNLCNLETLIVEFNGIPLKLPKTIWRMKMLRHLEFPKGCVFELDDDDHEECQKSLENLQFLSHLVLDDNTIARAVLQRLPNVQKLKCTLRGSGWMGEVFTIDFLRNLESLYLGSLMDDPHVSFPLTLKRLHFCSERDCSEDILSAIEELPYLEVLKLEGSWWQWEVKNGQFQKLKCLNLEVNSLEEWNVSFDSFYCLEQLTFQCCYFLKEIPACFAECPTLHMIKTIDCCEELVHSAIQILQEQKDNGNEVFFEKMTS